MEGGSAGGDGNMQYMIDINYPGGASFSGNGSMIIEKEDNAEDESSSKKTEPSSDKDSNTAVIIGSIFAVICLVGCAIGFWCYWKKSKP